MSTNEPPANPPGDIPPLPPAPPPPPPPPPAPPSYPGGDAPSGFGPVAPQNQKAVWSLVLGILGIVCCGLIAAIPAVILGHLAKKEVAAAAGAQRGEGMAQAGFILGIIGIVLSVLVVLFWLAFVAGGGLQSLPETY